MNKWETLHHSRCSNFRELQQSIAREPSAPNFNVPAYQSTPAAPAAGPTPAPRTVFVSSNSQSRTLNTSAAHVRPMNIYIYIYITYWSVRYRLLPADSTCPAAAAAPGKAPATSKASTTKLHPSGSIHHSHQHTTHWPSHWQPSTYGSTIPGPGTTLPQLSGLSRVSFSCRRSGFLVQINPHDDSLSWLRGHNFTLLLRNPSTSCFYEFRQ